MGLQGSNEKIAREPSGDNVVSSGAPRQLPHFFRRIHRLRPRPGTRGRAGQPSTELLRNGANLPEARKLARHSDIKRRPIEWLWQQRIPLGELTILDGDPGSNKSSLTIDLAARFSRGEEKPDGSAGVCGGVLLLIGEESISKTVPLRLEAAGADMEQVAVLDTNLSQG